MIIEQKTMNMKLFSTAVGELMFFDKNNEGVLRSIPSIINPIDCKIVFGNSFFIGALWCLKSLNEPG